MKLLFYVFLLFVLVNSTVAQTVTTWSGSKTTTGNSNNVALASALWAQPHSMCADASDNLWVSDDANHCVKLIRFGQVYNRVGSQYAPGTAGAYGYANALSSSAKFNKPRGIVCDASNNIYVCDFDNNAIRKIAAFTTIGNAQEVTTLCGAPETTGIAAKGNVDGTGLNARFDGPSGICRDNSGNFYVTDENNNNIRKIVIATGAVTTLCGNASGAAGGLTDGNYATAKFKWPRGIAFSASENALYVCDFGNSRIRKIDLTTQTVSVYLGSASGSRNGFMGQDGNRLTAANSRATEGIALDYLGNVFFTSSANAHTIRRIEKTTGYVLTLSGSHQVAGNTDGFSTNARFSTPTSMYLTSDKTTMYVCDNANGLIRSIDLRPTADFRSNYTALATGAIATLIDTSLSMVNSWSWTITPGTVNVDYQFMSGTTASSQNPQVKFLVAGTYTVKLDATNPYGTGSKTRTSYIVVSAGSGQPTADFVADKVFGPVSTIFKFTNQTTNSNGCTYSWTFAPSAGISFLNGTNQNSANPEVRFPATGLYTVTLNVTHATFTVSPKVKTNYINVTGVGINNTKNDFLFTVFPNPGNGKITLKTNLVLTDATAEVIDLQGKVVSHFILSELTTQDVNLTGLSTGIYLIKLIAAGKVATQRIVIE